MISSVKSKVLTLYQMKLLAGGQTLFVLSGRMQKYISVVQQQPPTDETHTYEACLCCARRKPQHDMQGDYSRRL